jgi:hypothetical protein
MGRGMNEEDDMRRPMAAIAAAASTLCIGLAAGEAADAPDADGTASESGIDVQVPDSKDRIEEYWTRDRMRAAKPMPKPVINRETDSPAAPEEGISESE